LNSQMFFELPLQFFEYIVVFVFKERVEFLLQGDIISEVMQIF
jgi:hypothetical protein